MAPVRRKIIRRTTKPCQFCVEKKEPYFKDVAALSRFLSERGRIEGRIRTGVCAKHQRVLTREIKRARHLALLPFVAGL